MGDTATLIEEIRAAATAVIVILGICLGTIIWFICDKSNQIVKAIKEKNCHREDYEERFDPHYEGDRK